MKRHIFKKFLIIAAFGLFSALSVIAQNDLNGRYSYKIDKNSSDFLLTFEREDAVYYSYAYEGYGTIGGKWTNENGLIKVTLKRGETAWFFTLKPKGADLELAETFSKTGTDETPDFTKILPAGTIFKKDTSQPTAPDLTSAEIKNRVTKLINSIKTAKDISPENIELQTGVKVSFDKENRNRYSFGGKVTGAGDWTYGIYAYPHPLKKSKTADTLLFSFSFQFQEPAHPEIPKVFQNFNLKDFSQDLQKAGFSAPKPQFGEHGRLLGWIFTRGTVQLNVSARGSLEKSNLTPNEDNYIEMIVVSFSETADSSKAN